MLDDRCLWSRSLGLGFMVLEFGSLFFNHWAKFQVPKGTVEDETGREVSRVKLKFRRQLRQLRFAWNRHNFTDSQTLLDVGFIASAEVLNCC